MTNAIEKTENQTPELAQKGGGIVAYLDSIKPKLQEAATKHLDPDRLIRVFLGEAQRNPKLLQCEMSTIVAALSLCNQTGLEPGGTMGHCYLIPRRNNRTGKTECNFQLGYKGLAELARRSGEIQRANAAPVYHWEIDRDLFKYNHEPPVIHHQWVPDAPEKPDPKSIVGAYAVVELRGGQRVQCWLSREQIEKRRKVAASKSGPWSTWYPEMCRKTALRAVLNGGLVPISVNMREAMDNDVDDWTQTEAASVPTRNVRAIQDFAPPAEPEPPAIETTAEPVEPETDWAAEWRRELESYQATEKDARKALDQADLVFDGAPQTKEQFNAAVSALESVLGA
jgi:recombination protein RecT